MPDQYWGFDPAFALPDISAAVCVDRDGKVTQRVELAPGVSGCNTLFELIQEDAAVIDMAGLPRNKFTGTGAMRPNLYLWRFSSRDVDAMEHDDRLVGTGALFKAAQYLALECRERATRIGVSHA